MLLIKQQENCIDLLFSLSNGVGPIQLEGVLLKMITLKDRKKKNPSLDLEINYKSRVRRQTEVRILRINFWRESNQLGEFRLHSYSSHTHTHTPCLFNPTTLDIWLLQERWNQLLLSLLLLPSITQSVSCIATFLRKVSSLERSTICISKMTAWSFQRYSNYL